MGKSRVLWVLWLVFAFLFLAMTGSNAAYLLLLVSVVLPLVSGLITKGISGRLDAELSASAYGEKGKEISVGVSVKNTGFFPADRLICQVCCENLLTGEKEFISLRMAAPARTRARMELWMKSRHAGRVRISLRRITCFDLFGLFRFQVRPSEEVYALTMVSPHTFSVETQIAYGESTNMDSDEYSIKKAGYDPSETFAIREYRPGDRMRQIHWKLTEKFDNLMVRDYGLPIQNTILLLLETGRLSQSEKIEPDCLDALAEAILSVSQELLSQQIVHSVGWQNHEENIFSCMEVENEEELSSLFPGLLGAVPGEDARSVAEHYMENREQLEFAHVVIFTPQHRPNLAFLSGQCLLTEVIVSPGGDGLDQQDGIAIVEASPETLTETLSYIEI